MVKPITASLTPRSVAADVAPLTSTLEPIVRMTIPAINRTTAMVQPPRPALASISGSAPSLPSGSSRAVRISQMVLITSARSNATPDCQVT